MARRMSRLSCTPAPSSVKSRTPSAASSAIGASCSPCPADGDRARGAHVARRLAAQLEHLAGHRGRVDGRDGVGHGEDARVAADRGAAGAGLDGLGLLLARLAQVGVDVDEAGAHDAAAGVEHPRARRGRGRRRAIVPSSPTTTSPRPHAGGVDEPAALDDERGCGAGGHQGPSGEREQIRTGSEEQEQHRHADRRRRCGPGR